MDTVDGKNERYASLLLAYLKRSPVHVRQLNLQSDMNRFLENAISEIIEAAHNGQHGDKLQAFARLRLEKLVNEKLVDGKSLLCLGSVWETRRLIIKNAK